MKRITEELGVVSVISPVSQGAGAVNGSVIDMSGFSKVVFVLSAGVLGASATVDLAIKGDTASGGSYSTTITGKSITQMVKATDDNKIAIIEVTSEEAGVQGFRYLRPTVTVGTAASLVSLIALGKARYAPASETDLAAVKEIVG